MIPLTIILVALAVFDTWYTYHLFDQGYTEANNVMKWLMSKLYPRWVYMSTVLFYVVFSGWLWISTERWTYYVAMGIAIAINGYVIFRNWRITRRK